MLKNNNKQELLLLHDFEVSKILGVSINTLRNWRYQKRGPSFIRMEGRSVMYEQSAVQLYIDKQRIKLCRM